MTSTDKPELAAIRTLIESGQAGEIDDETRALVEREMPDLVPKLPPDPEGVSAAIEELSPGSPQAIAQGCICDPGKNNGGRGEENDGLRFQVDKRCPLHGIAAVKAIEAAR